MNSVVIGLQWGDEGKAKVVDFLSKDYDLIVRFQGGANAGHTVFVGDKKFVFHLIPSGILRENALVGLASGVALDPDELEKEVSFLVSNGVDVDGRLIISPFAHIVLPVHKYLDAARENYHGKKIGTTLRGIGPCYEDRASRYGVRVADVVYGDPVELGKRVEELVREKNALLELYGFSPVDPVNVLVWLKNKAELLSRFTGDLKSVIQSYVLRGKNVLFEGAQGVMLDRDFGTYPFVTSSRTLPSEVFLSGGFPPSSLNVIGVAKAYTTRVGSGPFPTEEKGEVGEFLRKNGNEYGATTGRPRRCGWIDLVALKYAVEISGVSELFITKLDVLAGLQYVKAAVKYRVGDEETDSFPPYEVSNVEPIYKEFDGFEEDVSNIRNWNSLPVQLREFVEFIEDFLNVPVKRISVGRDRNAVVEKG